MDHRKPQAIALKLTPEKQAAFIKAYAHLLNQLEMDEAVIFTDALHPTPTVRPVADEAGRAQGEQRGCEDAGRAGFWNRGDGGVRGQRHLIVPIRDAPAIKATRPERQSVDRCEGSAQPADGLQNHELLCTRRWKSRPCSGGIVLLRGGAKAGHL